MYKQYRQISKTFGLFFCSGFLSCFPAASAQVPAAAFEVATIKLAPQRDPASGSWSPPGTGRFTATHVTLALLMQLAYEVDSSQMANKPAWFDTTFYDVNAKPEEGIKLTRDELKPRLQDLLMQRFHLIVHMETRPKRGYALIIAKGGPHLTATKADHFPGYRIDVSPGQMRGLNWSMQVFAKYLTPAAGAPVIDETGIQGNYDVSFSYEPHLNDASSNPGADSNLQALPEALREATGLTLKSQNVPVETVVIDSVDKLPTAN